MTWLRWLFFGFKSVQFALDHITWCDENNRLQNTLLADQDRRIQAAEHQIAELQGSLVDLISEVNKLRTAPPPAEAAPIKAVRTHRNFRSFRAAVEGRPETTGGK